MVRLEPNDPLMLARQLPLKSVALILAANFALLILRFRTASNQAFAVLGSSHSINPIRWYSISSAAGRSSAKR